MAFVVALTKPDRASDDRAVAHGKASAAGLTLRTDLLAAAKWPKGPRFLGSTRAINVSPVSCGCGTNDA